jgi:hypothetical protein
MMLPSCSSTQTVGEPVLGVSGSTPMNRSAMITSPWVDLHGLAAYAHLAQVASARCASGQNHGTLRGSEEACRATQAAGRQSHGVIRDTAVVPRSRLFSGRTSWAASPSRGMTSRYVPLIGATSVRVLRDGEDRRNSLTRLQMAPPRRFRTQ